MSARHSYDFGLIGNCSYLSYIDKSTNVVWQCWPKFDSSFIFGSLMDSKVGGRFQVAPLDENYQSEQYYLENTNVLATEITSSTGKYRVIDYAPRFSQYDRYFKPLMLFRKIEKLEGNPSIVVKCEPKGEYGKVDPEVSFGSNHIRYRNLKDQVRLTSNIPLNYIHEQKPFILTETKYLVLSYGIPLEAPVVETAETFLRKTVDYWRSWVENCTTPVSLFQKEVIRSALVLKLHQYEDTGAIIAAGTTSLPEAPKSVRNWDYRYMWLRDTYYTLSAFSQLGHFDELGSFSHFVRNLVARGDLTQPVYSILGDKELNETVLDLEGYLGNQPVRIGNDAFRQKQFDIYGQVLLLLLPLYVDQRIITRRRLDDLGIIEKLLADIEAVMDTPDAGLWELRGTVRKHCYTYLFHWAGASAAEKIGRTFKHEALIKKAKNLKELAAKNIEACFDPQLQCYTTAVGEKDLDAALFQLVTMRYLDPKSERARKHVMAIKDQLIADKDKKGLFYRYIHKDDFGHPEVAFFVCSFWYVSALVAIDEVDSAIECFEFLLNCGNHLGLFSEDVSVDNKSQWGNIVQTYSHVGLVNAAFDIDRKVNRHLFLSDEPEKNTKE